MHLLAGHNRSEFLAVPSLIRFDCPMGSAGPEPSLLIKARTLLLKYIVQGVRLNLIFCPVEDRLLCALEILDETENPAILWSIIERDEEKEALALLAAGSACDMFLFNELAVNVAWASFEPPATEGLGQMASSATVGKADYERLTPQVNEILDRLNGDGWPSFNPLVMSLPVPQVWNPVFNQFITSHATASPVALFDPDEGGQQEQLATWLTDNLDPLGVHTSPQIPKGTGTRELTDVLLSHEYGSVLIESKALTIIGRDKLPTRVKLARDVAGHLEKGIKQLKGAIRKLKKGAPVTTKSGVEIGVERTQPAHAIVLIPDFGLIEDPDTVGIDVMQVFMEETGGFLHLLDVSELLRVVQAAEMLSEQSETVSPIMAFDYYLMERAKKAVNAGTLRIEVLLRLDKE